MASADCYSTLSGREPSEEWLSTSDGMATRRLNWIRQTALFRNLSSADTAEVAAAAKERSFPAKQPIFCEDDPARFVFILISGRVKVIQFSHRGKEVILRIHGPGEIVDELGLAPGSTHRFTALPIETCRVLAWELRTFQAFTQRFPALQGNVTCLLISRLHKLQQRFCDLATERVPQRLARILVNLANQDGESSPHKLLVGLSCEELSQMTGTTVFTVSRLLSQWSELGIISTERRSVLVENLSDLTNLAEGKDS